MLALSQLSYRPTYHWEVKILATVFILCNPFAIRINEIIGKIQFSLAILLGFGMIGLR
jgi:hypothetical protein